MAVTLKDIAHKCGLAVSTVSNILNDNATSFASDRVKLSVKQTAAAMGYRKHYLSVSLRTKRTLSIGLCLDHILYETRHDFLEAFVQAFNARGYEVAVNSHEADPERALSAVRFFQERCKDAIVLFTDFLRDIGPARRQLTDALAGSGVRALGVGSELRGLLPCVDVDRDWAFRDCIRRLRRAGHRRTLVVYKTPADFRATFAQFSGPEFVLVGDVHTPADFLQRWPQVRREHPDATAAFFRTDEIAVAALAHFHRTGVRVPQDLAVMSFDRFRFSEYVTPPLTTYAINFDRLGALTFELLHAWIRGERKLGPAFHETIRPTFIERESHVVTARAGS